MVFSSLTFLFFFLPCTVLVYYLCGKRAWRNAALLVFSLLFYSWGEPKNVLIFLGVTAVAYLGGLLIERERLGGRSSRGKAAFCLSVVLVSANLFLFKYFNFTVRNIEFITGRSIRAAEFVLPIGISFYTFQLISYLADVNRAKIAAQRNFFRLLLYVSFFPQLIAGPIVRYETVANEIADRHESAGDFWEGLKRFITGISKKLIIANNVALVADIIFSGDKSVYGTAAYWLAALAYTLQIYFDFSGYSDMAIGIGRMFGFHFLENFNFPYASLSVTEFWRRWHISLSSWFRDYVYIPLGGNRCSRRRWLFNIAVVWMLTGLWHGAEWNFVLWGVFNGALLIIEKLLPPAFREKLPRPVQWLLTFVIVNIGWVIFYHTDFSSLASALATMFSLRPTVWNAALTADARILLGLLFIPLGLFFMVPLMKLEPPESRVGEVAQACLYLGLLGICIMFALSSNYNPFIYFRF